MLKTPLEREYWLETTFRNVPLKTEFRMGQVIYTKENMRKASFGRKIKTMYPGDVVYLKKSAENLGDSETDVLLS